MELHSWAFAQGGWIPRRHSADGGNISPPLHWQGAPPATQAYALIVDGLTPHQYRFQLSALAAPLDLPPGATAADLRQAMAPHLLEQTELTGVDQYQGEA